MRKLRVKKSTLTPDWHKEIQSHFTDVVKRKLGDRELPSQRACEQVEKLEETFCTGSKYEGQWDHLGFAGKGTYVYPHGAKYQGDFWDGQFHGHGTITYPGGQQLVGTWQNGKLVEKSFKYADGLTHDKEFGYCLQPDRRFQIEKDTKLKPPDKELMSNTPAKKLPKNCYDTADGYYNPETKLVYGYDNRVMRVVSMDEEKQIKDKYRQETDKPETFAEGMYRYWTSGRRKEIEELVELLQQGEKSEETATVSSTQKSISIYSFHMEAI